MIASTTSESHARATGEQALEIEETRRALLDLRRCAACCGPSAAPVDPTNDRPAPRRRRGARQRHHVQPVSRRFVLPEVTVIEPDVSRTVGDLLVADGRIVDLVAVGAPVPAGYQRLEAYRGRHVTPALVDMHGHFPPDNILALTGRILLLYLAHGVTTVRDAGDLDGTAVPAVRDGLADGRFIGPRALLAGPFVTRPPARWENSLFVDGPGDAGRVVDELVGRGMACMKLYENLRRDEIVALERAARERGLVTLGHVPTRLGFEEAPLADAQHFFGVPPPASLPRDHVLDRTCHWAAVDDRRMDVVVRAAVEGQRANTPTLVLTERLVLAGASGVLDDAATRLMPSLFRDVVWHPAHGLPAYRGPTAERAARLGDAFDKKLALVGRLHRAGAPLHLGCDVQQPFVVPGASLHAELRLFVQAGIPSAAVLRMATRDAALALGLPDLGTTRTGARADLLVCDGDPSMDPAALATIRAVVHDGALYDRGALDRELADDLAVRDRTFERIATRVIGRLAMWRVARNFVG